MPTGPRGNAVSLKGIPLPDLSSPAANDYLEFDGAGGMALEQPAATPNVIGSAIFAEGSYHQTAALNWPEDDTIPQRTEGEEILSGVYTPKSATSTLYLLFTSRAASGYAPLVALFHSNSLDAIVIGSPSGLIGSFQPGSTNPITLSARAAVEGSTPASITFGGSTSRKYGGTFARTLLVLEVE